MITSETNRKPAFLNTRPNVRMPSLKQSFLNSFGFKIVLKPRRSIEIFLHELTEKYGLQSVAALVEIIIYLKPLKLS